MSRACLRGVHTPQTARSMPGWRWRAGGPASQPSPPWVRAPEMRRNPTHAACMQARMAEERCPPGDPRPRAPGPGARVQYAPHTRPRPPVAVLTLQVLAPWLLPHESCVATAQATAQHRTVVPALSLRLTALYATFKIDTLSTHARLHSVEVRTYDSLCPLHPPPHLLPTPYLAKTTESPTLSA